jgi:hypothetical protein
MKLQNKSTGDILEVPRPDFAGRSVVCFNSRVVERVLYSDENGGSVTTEDGRIFTVAEWAAHLIERLRVGAWKVVN